MPIIVQCPNPACGVSSPAADAVSGRNVRCKRCGTPFVAIPTFDGQKSDTRKNQPSSGANPFPVLPAEFGRYRIQRLLGRGGMGVVYLAVDSTLGRQVALKMPFFDASESPQRAERFVREARSAAILQHPSICTVFDAGEIDGRPFITMAYVAGKPLEDEIDPDAPMAQLRAAEIARKIALALEHAHAKGIVHRDLKPANIIMTADGEPVVMDFGLAKRLADVDPNEAKLTRLGGVLGTPSYMSPEQVRGESSAVGLATDVYALGVMLFEMLTGHTPYRGSLGVVMLQIQTAPVPPVIEFRPDVDSRLDAVCRKAMAKESADRFASMAEFADILSQYLKAPVAVPIALAVAAAAPVSPAPLPASYRCWLDDLADATPLKLAPKKLKRGLILAAAVALALLAPLGIWLAVAVLRVETANGTLVVEMDDKEVEARIKNGKLILSGPDGKDRYILTASDRNEKLQAGSYTVRVEGADGLALDTPEFTLQKGGRVTVRVTAAPKAAVAMPNDFDREAAEYVLSLGGSVRVNDRDDDLKGIADLPREAFRLTGVMLGGTQATDAGLAHFKDCKALTSLNLSAAKVTDRGLAYFKGCENLTYLNLDYTGAGDAGLASFKDCKRLTGLGLNGTGVTDAGMAYFRGCAGLNVLNFYGTQVGDVGLAIFKDCKSLRSVSAGVTRVTAAGVAELKKALPLCIIERDGGVVPTVGVSPDREAAEYALSLGGAVRVNDQGGEIKAVADLPRETFRLTGVILGGTPAADAGMTHFKDSKSLTRLILSGTKVTDAGLAAFKDCKGLTWLDLDYLKVGDPGLANFKDCKSLQTVGLNGTGVTDAGLAQFQDCTRLSSINLGGTQVSNVGLANLQGCKGLKGLAIAYTRVSDLSPLRSIKLTRLYCEKARVTDLSPLKGMPLEDLNCDFRAERDADVLRSVKTLVTINGKPAADFWKEVEPAKAKTSLAPK